MSEPATSRSEVGATTELISAAGPDAENEDEDISIDDCMEVIYSFKCKFCAFTTRTPQGITSHVRAVHLKGKKFGIKSIKNETPDFSQAQDPKVTVPFSTTSEEINSSSDNMHLMAQQASLALPVLQNGSESQEASSDTGTLQEHVIEEFVVDTSTSDPPAKPDVDASQISAGLAAVPTATATTSTEVYSQSSLVVNAGVPETGEVLQTHSVDSSSPHGPQEERPLDVQIVNQPGGQVYGILSLQKQPEESAVVPVSGYADSAVQHDGVAESTQSAETGITPEQLNEAFTLAEAEGIISSAQDSGISIEMVEDSTMQLEPVTKEVYVCGQCNDVFTNIDSCKEHMSDVHNISFSSSGLDIASEPDRELLYLATNKVSVGTQATGYRKPGRKPKRKLVEGEADGQMGEKPADEAETQVEDDLVPASDDEREVTYTRSGRRALRLPAAFREDYLVPKRKLRKKQHRPRTTTSKLSCEIEWCKAKFATEASLDIHTQCHNKEDDVHSPFQCISCSEKFPVWRLMRKHLWKAHSVDIDLFKCSTCEYRTDTASKLAVHEHVHGKDRLFKCDVCDKGFKQQAQLTNHQTCHVTDDKKPVNVWYSSCTCKICGRKYCNKKSLKVHVEAVHNKVKPFICSYCGHSTARKAMMQLHIRTHTGDKPFKCDLCAYATSDHNTLRRHRMRHTGQKDYTCPLCPYSCIQAISLKTHIKNKHPDSQNEGIFECKICHYRTVNAKSWSNHLQDHEKGLIQENMLETPKQRSNQTQSVRRHTVQIPAIPVSDSQKSVTDHSVASTEQDSVEQGVSDGTAQIIYSALNAVSQQQQGQLVADGQNLTIVVDQNGQTVTVPEDNTAVRSLLPNNSAAVSQPGTQTITVRLPFSQEGSTVETGEAMLTVQEASNIPEEQTVDISDTNDGGEISMEETNAESSSNPQESNTQLQGIISAIQQFQENSDTTNTGAQVITMRDSEGNEHMVTLTPLTVVDEEGHEERQYVISESTPEETSESPGS